MYETITIIWQTKQLYLQTSVPPSTKREEKVDLFQFMLDMLITLWYGSNTILDMVAKQRPL